MHKPCIACQWSTSHLNFQFWNEFWSTKLLYRSPKIAVPVYRLISEWWYSSVERINFVLRISTRNNSKLTQRWPKGIFPDWMIWRYSKTDKSLACQKKQFGCSRELLSLLINLYFERLLTFFNVNAHKHQPKISLVHLKK